MPGHGILKGKKTYVTAALTVLGVGAAYLLGEVEPGTALNSVITAILAATLRSGIANAK